MNKDAPVPINIWLVAQRVASLRVPLTLTVLGSCRSRNAHAIRLLVKLVVPAVCIPAFLYSSGKTSSHSLPKGLSGLAVIAMHFLANLFAFRARLTLARVSPLTDTMSSFFPSVLGFFLAISYGPL